VTRRTSPERLRQMKRPSLKPEDGAEFFGLVEPIDGLFRASCYAKTAHQTEEPEFKMRASEDEALKWIGMRTRQRGFPYWKLGRARTKRGPST